MKTAAAVWGAIRRALFGPDLDPHVQCRIDLAVTNGRVIGHETEAAHARMALNQAEADLASLEMAVLAWGHRIHRTGEALDLVDRQRDLRKRKPLGQLRALVQNGTLIPATREDGEPYFQAPADQALTPVFMKRIGLIMVLLMALALPAGAADLVFPIGLYGAGGVGDYVSTEYAGPGRTYQAPGGGTLTVVELNDWGQTRGDRILLKSVTTVGFAAGDVGLQTLEERAKRGGKKKLRALAAGAKWALRFAFAYKIGPAIIGNVQNGQAVRR